MVAVLLGVLLTIAAPDTTGSLEACLSIGPGRTPPAITSLNEAQQSWLEAHSVPADTLRADLSRVHRARRCFRRLTPAEVERPYIGNVLETYEAEAELWAALRDFSKAFGAYEEGRSYLRSVSPAGRAGYADARATWPPFLHQEQGYLHYLLGDLSASIEQYLNAYRATPDSALSQQARFLMGVGILHQRMQDYRSTRRYYQRAERLLQDDSLSADTHPEQRARLLANRADLVVEQAMNTDFRRRDLERAREFAAQAIRLVEPGTERYARSAMILSETLGYLGEHQRAYELNEAVRTYARSHEDVRLHTFARLKLGILHTLSERWHRADTTLTQALAATKDLGDLDYQRRTLEALGRLHELQGEWSSAERYYRAGVEVVEEYRESLAASQWSMTALSEWQTVHRGLVRCLLAQGHHREALRALDRTRARHLQDLRIRARIAEEFSPSKRARLDSLSRSLTHVRNQLGAADLRPARATALRNRETALMAARQQLLDVPSSADRPSIDRMLDVLARQDRALVSYFIDDPWPVYGRAARSAAFVLHADTLRVVSLGSTSQDSVESQIHAASPLFASETPPGQLNAMHFDLRPLHQLYNAIYAPVARHLREGRPLTVVPDGPLFRIPLGMLARELPGGRYAPREARFVIHERPTSVALAASLVPDTAPSDPLPRPGAQSELAAFGVSEYDTLRSVPTALRSALPRTALDSSLSPPSLPGVRSEIEAVRERVGNVTATMGAAATEPAFRRAIQEAGILHLASHALVHPTSPLHNAVLLRPDSVAGSDGVLFLHELTTRRDRLALVVLSGCSTARGALHGGEGMEGLQYAFRAMGAQSTVSTLWPVADDASVELMDHFYAQLQAGQAKDEALRQARLQLLREHPEWASPFFWGPTVLYGSPTALTLAGPGLPLLTWVLLGLAGLLLVASALLWWHRHRLPPPFCHLVRP